MSHTMAPREVGDIATPEAGKATVFVDSEDGLVKAKTPDGEVADPGGGGGGGSGYQAREWSNTSTTDATIQGVANEVTRVDVTDNAVTVLLPNGVDGVEVWIKEVGFSNNNPLTISAPDAMSVESTTGDLLLSDVVYDPCAGRAWGYKFDAVQARWALLTFYMPIEPG